MDLIGSDVFNSCLQSVLFIPFIASLALGLVGGSIGALVVFKKQSLLGETLSHACYPGLALGLWLVHSKSGIDEEASFLLVVLSGMVIATLAYWAIQTLVHRFRVPSDSALCAILASFFALGLLFISAVQNKAPTLAKKLQALLLGQAATVSEGYAILCIALAIIVCILFIFLFRPLQCELFDPRFAALTGLRKKYMQFLVPIVVVLTLIIGSKVMGVVLMSALLIFPTVIARMWSSSFFSLLLFSSSIGAFSCGTGLLISHYVSGIFQEDGRGLSIPSGPSITVLLAMLFFLSYLFSPRIGVIAKIWKRIGFKSRCEAENLLKAIWRLSAQSGRSEVLISEVAYSTVLPTKTIHRLASKLRGKGYISLHRDGIRLTHCGEAAACKLVRLHRLWELYLVELCDMAKDRVHPSAEEMEHILTPQIEQELESLLQYPKVDPHKQPIPSLTCRIPRVPEEIEVSLSFNQEQNEGVNNDSKL